MDGGNEATRRETNMKQEKIKAWVTKYASTSGIMLVDGAVDHGINSELLKYGNTKENNA